MPFIEDEKIFCRCGRPHWKEEWQFTEGKWTILYRDIEYPVPKRDHVKECRNCGADLKEIEEYREEVE